MYQQLTLVGYLGADPEMRFTQSGVPVANANLATSRRWTANDGTPQEKTTWFRLSWWNKAAETASQYLKKGSKILVIGEIEQARPWTDRDGNLQATIEVRVHQFKFLDSRSDDGGGNGGSAPTPHIDDEEIPF
ncbi:MAG: single-stranded DNA-binding protein [Caldilineaceae bacterium]|nr:single-stranded DNA-binding protein [Caldilineaceae bacterium]